MDKNEITKRLTDADIQRGDAWLRSQIERLEAERDTALAENHRLRNKLGGILLALDALCQNAGEITKLCEQIERRYEEIERDDPDTMD